MHGERVSPREHRPLHFLQMKELELPVGGYVADQLACPRALISRSKMLHFAHNVKL